MRALVVGAMPVAGSAELVARLAARADLIVAADGAAEWCIDHGIRPDLAVGDFDSALPGAPRRLSGAGVEVMQYPAEKDESDLDLAVAVARERGADLMTLSACTSGRLDHTLAALGTAALNADLSTRIVEPHVSVWAVGPTPAGPRRIDLEPGTTVSVMSVSNARGVTLEGFRYPLQGAELDGLSSLGLSNIAEDPQVRVSVSEGVVLVIVADSGITF